MASLRPKTKLKPKSKYNNGLPQFYSYKDKAITNDYSSHQYIRLAFNLYHRYSMLVKLFFISLAIYFTYDWAFSSSPESGKKLTSEELWASRKLEVKNTFLQSWNDYVKHGWGYDIYAPVKQTGKNMVSKPLGWIIVDSLDTLMLMGCEEELEDAKNWVDKELDYDINADVNVFETTIRMLGGLLSAHYLSDDDDTVFLEKAVILGNKLVSAFDTPTGIPVMELNLKSQKPGKQGFPAMGASTSEIATLQLEFKYLSNLTGEAYFWDAAEKVMDILDSNQYKAPGIHNEYDGLAPIYVNQFNGEFKKELIRLGSRGDSYYEYLLKQYLQTDENRYLEMYEHAFKGIKKHLMRRSYPNKLVYLGELPNGINGELDDKMDHLVCFIGGLFVLGATRGLTESNAKSQPWWNELQQEQLDLGKELAKTCYHMYHDTPGTGLSPEIVVFSQGGKNDLNPDHRGTTWSSGGDFYIKPNDKHNLQRPETVETLYYLYKITGDIKYREWGWEIFENFVTHTSISDPNGKNVRYTTLKDCTVSPSVKADNMESFWLAETLKYLYLLFDDETGTTLKGELKNGKPDKWDIKNMVFNTEAHPLPKFDRSKFVKGTGEAAKLPNTFVKDNEERIRKVNEAADALKRKLDVEANKKASLEHEEAFADDKKVEAIREMRMNDDVHEEFNSEYVAFEEKLEAGPKDSSKKEQPVEDEFSVDDIEKNLNQRHSDKQDTISNGNLAKTEKEKGVEVPAERTTASKDDISKPLNVQAEEAKIESDLKLTQKDEKEGVKLLDNDVAKPLDEQVKEVLAEAEEKMKESAGGVGDTAIGSQN